MKRTLALGAIAHMVQAANADCSKRVSCLTDNPYTFYAMLTATYTYGYISQQILSTRVRPYCHKMLSLEDLPVPTVEKQVDIGREIVIPWIHRELALGTGFSSKLVSTPNPWITAKSPFNIEVLRKQRLLYDGKVEGRHNFRDAESTSHSTGMEHTSGSLGVTVGCSFLSASVTGSYDKTVLETKDVRQP